MPLRSSMAQLITRVRLLISDPNPPPSGGSLQFQDQDVQDTLDESRDDLRYEPLLIAPTIVNTASTGNQPQTIFVNYYSKFQWWEQDAVVQGYSGGQAWVVLTPSQADYITGRWWFESASLEFTAPTVPGQLPPVFATGKVYDVYAAAADLLEMWAGALASAYAISANGKSLHREQMGQARLKLAEVYRRKAKPRVAKLVRSDVAPDLGTRRMRLLDATDLVKGG